MLVVKKYTTSKKKTHTENLTKVAPDSENIDCGKKHTECDTADGEAQNGHITEVVRCGNMPVSVSLAKLKLVY